ncbi:hypothetical protein F4677DRAFT_334270 [Hypoxylon crocopeplum]|nr:hypothetical protein F4677DRAFT_334270 [Hypoxylon crocopeplum]
MPTYLCHGFRWHRRSIRYFVVIQNVDDAAPEWIVARPSSVALLDQFYELFDFLPPSSHPARSLSPSPHRVHNGFPTSNGHTHSRNHSYGGQGHKEKNSRLGNGENRNSTQQSRASDCGRPSGQLTTIKQRDDTSSLPSPQTPETGDGIPFNNWSVVKFLEEFDPSDLSVVSGPWAYVADYVVRVDTSVSVADEISRYEAKIKTEPNKPMGNISDEAGRRVNTFGNKKAGWLEKLRDQLQRSESIRWYVVVCGDEERSGLEMEEVGDGEGTKDSKKANGQEHRSSPRSSHGIRGLVENGFEFRLPEFLGPPRTPEQGPRRRRVEKRMAKQNSTPLPENDQPVIPPLPAPIQVTHKMPAEDTVTPKTPKSSSGLRRLFLRRKADGPT